MPMMLMLNKRIGQQGKMRTRRLDLPLGSGCRVLRVKACGPSHSLAAGARSSDRNSMRGVLQPKGQCCTKRGAESRWPTTKRREYSVTHLSNTPSVSPTLPGPNSTPQCSIDMRPESQGMRELSSTSCDAQLHNFMLTMGCFDASGRLRAGWSGCGNCDWRFASTGD
jgi:hypothetical protein